MESMASVPIDRRPSFNRQPKAHAASVEDIENQSEALRDSLSNRFIAEWSRVTLPLCNKTPRSY